MKKKAAKVTAQTAAAQKRAVPGAGADERTFRRILWRKNLTDQEITFLWELLVTGDRIAAWRATSKARATSGVLEAFRGGNGMFLSLKRRHPEVVEEVLSQINLLNRTKVELEVAAKLDSEDEEKRADAVNQQLRQMTGVDRLPPPPENDRESRPLSGRSTAEQAKDYGGSV